MLSIDIQKESISKRIEEFVKILMAERSIFREELDYDESVKLLVRIFSENFSLEEFNAISDESLKKRCSRIMVTEAVAGTLNELTPEEIAIFDEAIKRK